MIGIFFKESEEFFGFLLESISKLTYFSKAVLKTYKIWVSLIRPIPFMAHYFSSALKMRSLPILGKESCGNFSRRPSAVINSKTDLTLAIKKD